MISRKELMDWLNTCPDHHWDIVHEDEGHMRVLFVFDDEDTVCQNPYCEAEATHKAPHDEHYCSECIHEHVYEDHDPDPSGKEIGDA